jgi:hypothetical protein
MAVYTAHPTVITGQIWAASDQMTYVAGNLQALFVYTTKGDIAVAKSASELSRVAIGSDGTLWVADSSQTAGVRAGQLPIRLPISSVIFPISGITAAGMRQMEGSGADPKPNFLELSFVSTSDTWAMWKTILPSLFGASPVLRIHGYMDSATSGNIGFGVRLAALSDGDGTVEAKVFGTTNIANEAVPGTAKTKFVLDIPLTNTDSMAKDDELMLGLYRNTAVGSNASGICYVTDVQIVYG